MLPARSDLLWGQGGRWRAGQAAHPHCSQAGPAPSCLLRLTWAVPGPDPTRLHWPLGNPEVRLSQVEAGHRHHATAAPGQGHWDGVWQSPFPPPCPRPLQHGRASKATAGCPPLLPARGHSSSPERAVTLDTTCTTRGCQCHSQCFSGPGTLRPGGVASRIGILCPPGDPPARCEVRLHGVGAQWCL